MAAIDSLNEFDDIRPYTDDELPERLASLVRDPDLVQMACRIQAPFLYRLMPLIARWIVGSALRRRSKSIGNLSDLQSFLASYVERMVRSTTDGFSHSGTEHLPKNEPCLYVSNHRDIVLDSIFVNYALWQSGVPFTQNAVGDNLLQGGLGNELMRLNRSFTVVRGAKTRRAQYHALLKTSRYIRKTIEHGESIWIAQRQGRSKDGLDRTDPAILKMFQLAYRADQTSFADWLSLVNVVPVSISYELDPCAPMKAHELFVRETTGSYTKDLREDFRSIAQGIKGFKGRVHVSFAKTIPPLYSNANELAEKIDEQMNSQKKIFETYLEANRMLVDDNANCKLVSGRVRQEFEQQLANTTDDEKSFFLVQYANQLASDN
ncbi:MAG: 1-acyl-sn-glycerol-3-phosphate acyltransferase [Gammaproteobacteria bacterium]|nr:1-acyl-sn-glycerol-3-phosphate acyltransferase [Gammaproteobacteria bacterium]